MHFNKIKAVPTALVLVAFDCFSASNDQHSTPEPQAHPHQLIIVIILPYDSDRSPQSQQDTKTAWPLRPRTTSTCEKHTCHLVLMSYRALPEANSMASSIPRPARHDNPTGVRWYTV
ncbi:hypothetical protein D9619_004589 [Psilocybe cf. subviscida]|uniref:Secreted protein n=1 Tax=Psilocybe cf. subviscida TaxID=2480587 RepID=A0A8H5F846_9AGAR|nr:hypothetical protein D9619_004589 [Psilocybe cf. subviscida]